MGRLGYLAVLPLVAALTFIEIYPLAFGVLLSIEGEGGAFVGIANYVSMLQNPDFWNSLALSLLYSAGSTVAALGLGLGFTFLLSQAPRGKAFFESALIVPVAVPPIVAGVLWSPSAIWDDVNTFVHFVLHQPYIDVLSPFFFLPVMILSEAWEWSPLLMLIGLSITNSIRNEVFEAAAVHGASPWQTFLGITLPAILRSPVTRFVLVLRFIDALRAFEIPFAWSNWVGYQQVVGSQVDTLSLYLYKLLFFPIYNFPVQYVSAIAVSMLAITLLGSSLLLRLLDIMAGGKG